MSSVLSGQALQEAVDSLENWQLDQSQKHITRVYQTKNFTVAVDFISSIRDLAEAADHHPDLHLENYRQLTVDLSTHSAGGVTQKDIDLASQINSLNVELKK